MLHYALSIILQCENKVCIYFDSYILTHFELILPVETNSMNHSTQTVSTCENQMVPMTSFITCLDVYNNSWYNNKGRSGFFRSVWYIIIPELHAMHTAKIHMLHAAKKVNMIFLHTVKQIQKLCGAIHCKNWKKWKFSINWKNGNILYFSL